MVVNEREGCIKGKGGGAKFVLEIGSFFGGVDI